MAQVTTNAQRKLHTLHQIKYAASLARSHWFDRNNLRFFNSRIGERVYPVPGGALFVSSEQFRGFGSPDGPRLYTVRSCTVDGQIGTVGEFQQWATGKQAHAEAARLQRNGYTLEA